MTSCVGVVIPYYQRDPRLLETALASVVRQDTPEDVRYTIVIVDDGSPAPADAGLAARFASDRHETVILRQPNAGPGAARNAGLDYLDGQGVDLVAFLDSDDAWADDHIGTALRCLADDGAMFFSNHKRETFAGGQSYFEMNDKIVDLLGAAQGADLVSRRADGDYVVRPEAAVRLFLLDIMAQTSTVVFEPARCGRVRFDQSLTVAGEDLLFFIRLAQACRAVCFSSKVGAFCGRGVNIFHSTLSWNSAGALGRFVNQFMLWRYLSTDTTLTPQERVVVRDKAAGFERAFSYLWTRSLLRTGSAATGHFRQLRRSIGWHPARLVMGLAGALGRRLQGKAMFPEH